MLQCSRILLGYRGLMVNAASPMFEMSNVLPPHNLHFARPGSSSVLTHDMYFSICSQAWLNLHCKKTAIVFTGKNWQLSCQNNPVKNTSTCKPLYRAACKFNILNLYIQHWISAIFTSLLCYIGQVCSVNVTF